MSAVGVRLRISKVGYSSLIQGIEQQILKDVELIEKGRIEGSVWHCFKSPVTGQGGPSAPDKRTTSGGKLRRIV
jgi:hypothetical protein